MFTVLDGVQQYFFYLYNAQGDVIAIIDDYAERVVNYEYSAWGELLSVTGSKADTVGTLNPFRYRGYCYDTETGLYYLNSRYYGPVTQRFVNADGLLATGAILTGVDAFTTSKVSSATTKKSENLGKPFNPNGNKVQIGVDPRTTTPSKDLSNLDLQRLRNAEIYGCDQAISVYRNGVVEDGNHRLKNALTYKRSIDISIFD